MFVQVLSLTYHSPITIAFFILAHASWWCPAEGAVLKHHSLCLKHCAPLTRAASKCKARLTSPPRRCGPEALRCASAEGAPLESETGQQHRAILKRVNAHAIPATRTLEHQSMCVQRLRCSSRFTAYPVQIGRLSSCVRYTTSKFTASSVSAATILDGCRPFPDHTSRSTSRRLA